MKERIKTIILFFLVVSSLILTWILIYNIPNNGNVSVSEYLPRYRFGQDLTHEQLMGYQEMILHYGENQHTVLHSDSDLFQALIQELKKGSFYEFGVEQKTIDWQDLVENKKGIELKFSTPIPQVFLKSLLLVTSSENVPSQVNRVWIINNSQQEPYAYFFDDREELVYIAKTTISNVIFDRLLNNKEKLPLYSYFPAASEDGQNSSNFIYLPEGEVSVPVYKGSLLEVPNDHLIQLLFLDPTAVRNVYDRTDGQRVIYTDGSKSLQVYSNEHYLNFYQPVAHFQQVVDLEESLKTAIYYVNQQGGWGGNYSLKSIRALNKQSWEFIFAHQSHGLQILENEALQIRVQVSNGTVSFYQRPTMKIIESGETSRVKLKNKSSVIKELSDRGIKETDLLSVNLTYHMDQQRDGILFYPYWKILLKGQKQLQVPAY